MGTHPIFESDFDCLTDFRMLRLAGRQLAKPRSLGTLTFYPNSTFLILAHHERVVTYGFIQQYISMIIPPFIMFSCAYLGLASDWKNWRDGKAWKTYGRFRYED